MLTIGLVAAGGLLVAVVFFLLAASSSRDSRVVSLTQPAPVRSHTLSMEAREAVESALKRGQKIEAIKIYKEATGAGLKESKEAIDAMDSGAAQ